MRHNKISVVIICRNAVNTIEKSIASSMQLTNDVVVADSGSTDGTIEKIAGTGARLKQIQWNGYGHAKNAGNELALYDWILSVDADEYPDVVLINSLKNAALNDEEYVFTMQRLNYLGNKPIFFGEWGNDVVQRLFNRKNARWDTTPMHEELVAKKTAKITRLKGVIHHYTSPDIEAYKMKLKKYAVLMAGKYYANGKKDYRFKLYLSPAINFLLNYIFKGGFLDGKEGWLIALANAAYTFEKYKLLKEKYKGISG